MPDQLRERFDGLRHAAERDAAVRDSGEHTRSVGLQDVRMRRTRRTRNRVAAASALTVGAMALGAVLLVPQLGAERTSTAGGADALSHLPGAEDSIRVEGGERGGGEAATEPAPTADPPGAETVPEPPSVEESSDEAPPADDPLAGPFTLSAPSLLTWAEIAAVGESGPGTSPFEASLVFPPLCAAGSAPDQYSGPVRSFSAEWTVSDGRLSQSGLQYGTDQDAADALDRLVRDSQACPVFNEYASIAYTGTDADAGTEIAFFDLRLESGEDGSIRTAVITVTRVANVLVELALVPDGPVVADAQRRSRALAEAAVSKIVATG